MRIGSLSSKIELKSTTTSRDAVGQVVYTTANKGTAWANIEQLSAADATFADGIDQLNSYRVSILFNSTTIPAKGWKVYWGSKVLEVQASWTDLDARDYSYMTCLEVAS